MIRTRDLFVSSIALMRSNQSRLPIAIGAVTLGGIATDLLPSDYRLVLSIYGLVTIYCLFWMTAGLMSDLGLRPNDSAGFGTVFVVSVISLVGVVGGLILLIVPGLLLLGRWWMAVPIALAGTGNATDALRASWHQSRSRQWTLLLLSVTITALAIPGIVLTELGLQRGSVPVSILGNIVLAVATVLSWHSSVAAWMALTPTRSDA